MNRWLWPCAVLVWLVAIATTAVAETPAAAGNFGFSFSQVCVLVAIGIAWGEQRQWRKGVDARLNKLEMAEES